MFMGAVGSVIAGLLFAIFLPATTPLLHFAFAGAIAAFAGDYVRSIPPGED